MSLDETGSKLGETNSKLGEGISNYHQVSFDANLALSPACSICGKVSLESKVTVFAGAQLRGDCASIEIGEGTNIQENASLHVSNAFPLHIGKGVTVGHGACVHGCTIEDNVLIGMGSIVLDGAHVAQDSLVAAGAVVTEGKSFPPKSLIMGVPAKAVRQLSDQEVHEMISLAATDYCKVAQAMLADGVLLGPPKDANIWPVV